MLPQDRLRLLLTLYDRRLSDVAEAAGVSKATASLIINCRRPASPSQVARIEAAIIGSRPAGQPPTPQVVITPARLTSVGA